MSEEEGRYRSAVTGRYLTEDEAMANPRESYRDSAPNSVIAWTLELADGTLDLDFTGKTRETVEPYCVHEKGEKVVRVRVTVIEDE